MLRWPTKDPDDLLDYGIEWAAEIEDGDAIASSEWIADPDLTASNPAMSGTVTKVWLAGGVEGRRYTVTNRITTTAGRQMDRSVSLIVGSR